MAIPGYQEITLPLLRLMQQKKEIRRRDAVALLVDEFKLDEQERRQTYPKSGNNVFLNHVRWAFAYLKEAQLLESVERGVYAITPRGEEVLSSPPQQIDVKYLRRFREFDENRGVNSGKRKTSEEPIDDGKASLRLLHECQEDEEKSSTPEDIIHKALGALEDALAKELLKQVLAQTPEFFESLTVKLLVAMGYGGSVEEAGKVLGKSHDGGVDGVIKQDELGLNCIYVQAKRYDGNAIGAPVINSFSGALNRKGATTGVFVTTSSFTAEAVKAAEEMKGQRIVLIDGHRLVRLMIRHGVGCREEETLVIKKLDEDFFEEL